MSYIFHLTTQHVYIEVNGEKKPFYLLKYVGYNDQTQRDSDNAALRKRWQSYDYPEYVVNSAFANSSIVYTNWAAVSDLAPYDFFKSTRRRPYIRVDTEDRDSIAHGDFAGYLRGPSKNLTYEPWGSFTKNYSSHEERENAFQLLYEFLGKPPYNAQSEKYIFLFDNIRIEFGYLPFLIVSYRDEKDGVLLKMVLG